MEELFGNATPSVVKDPFSARCIEQISMHAMKGIFNDSFRFTGQVKFKNGSTGGTQDFKARNLGELYMKIAEFCQSLEGK